MAKRTYYTLAVFDGYWSPEFGDYDRDTVQGELEEYRERGVFKKHLRILKTEDTQASIDAAVAKLNSVKI
jgi:hypothetical protein